MMSRTAEVSYAIRHFGGAKLDDALPYKFTVDLSAGSCVSSSHLACQEVRHELYLRQQDLLTRLEGKAWAQCTRSSHQQSEDHCIAEDLQQARRHRNSCEMMTKYRVLDAVFRGDMDVDESRPGALEGLKSYECSCKGTSLGSPSATRAKRRSRRERCARSRILSAKT